MFTNIWQSISIRASHLITILPSIGPERPAAAQVVHNCFDPLDLPDKPDIRSLLSQAGLSIDDATHYETSFNDFIHQFSEYVKLRYQAAIAQISVQDASDGSVHRGYLRVLRSGFISSYNVGIEKALRNLSSRLAELECHSTMKDEVFFPTARSISSFPCNSASRQSRRGRPFIFSKEQTAVLRALLVHDDQFSTEEKELIAQTLNLTRAQVNRWFCNARARGGRKKPYEKPIPRAQRQNLSKYVSDVCQKQRGTSSSSSSGSSTCSQYPSSDDDVDMWPSNALQPNSDSDDSPYLTTEADPSENIIPMSQLYSQISSACDETSHETIETDQSLTSSNFFSQSTSSLDKFLLPNDFSSVLSDPDPFNLNTLSDDSFVQSISYSLNQSEQSWNPF